MEDSFRTDALHTWAVYMFKIKWIKATFCEVWRLLAGECSPKLMPVVNEIFGYLKKRAQHDFGVPGTNRFFLILVYISE